MSFTRLSNHRRFASVYELILDRGLPMSDFDESTLEEMVEEIPLLNSVKSLKRKSGESNKSTKSSKKNVESKKRNLATSVSGTADDGPPSVSGGGGGSGLIAHALPSSQTSHATISTTKTTEKVVSSKPKVMKKTTFPLFLFPTPENILNVFNTSGLDFSSLRLPEVVSFKEAGESIENEISMEDLSCVCERIVCAGASVFNLAVDALDGRDGIEVFVKMGLTQTQARHLCAKIVNASVFIDTSSRPYAAYICGYIIKDRQMDGVADIVKIVVCIFIQFSSVYFQATVRNVLFKLCSCNIPQDELVVYSVLGKRSTQCTCFTHFAMSNVLNSFVSKFIEKKRQIERVRLPTTYVEACAYADLSCLVLADQMWNAVLPFHPLQNNT